MIFVTVGGQMTFDRLVSAVDAWADPAVRRGRGAPPEVFAQTGPGTLRPLHIGWTRMLTPVEFRRRVAGASLVVAHAGMGTILTTLEAGRPLLVMPRRGDLGETRNDHQVATAERFRGARGVRVALDTEELVRALDAFGDGGNGGNGGDVGDVGAAERLASPECVPADASPELVAMLREFIFGGDTPNDGPTGARP